MFRLTAVIWIEGASSDAVMTTAPAYLISYEPEVVLLETLNVQVPALSMLSHDRLNCQVGAIPKRHCGRNAIKRTP